jgi:hypothetical protein
MSSDTDNRDTERFVIVGCGAAKRDGSQGQTYAAKELYTSTYFQKKREYAETVGDQWMILSAEHGLIPPTVELRPYETSIDDLDEDELEQLAHEVGMDLIEWVAWELGNGCDVDEIVVLAGKKYIKPLRQRETFHAGIDPTVVFPLQQNDLGGIGEQMAWLDARCEGHEQTTLMTDGGTDRERAEEFWSQYEIPFEHDTCIKVRRSGLLRGSSGTGHAKDTVVHLHVQEPFKDGRLSRDEDSYLCENDSFVGFQGREERWSKDGEAYLPPVTCDTCLQRMDRWKDQDVHTDTPQSEESI